MSKKKDSKAQAEGIIKILKRFWYYAGQWHDAECYFIRDDQGVCNCKTGNNLKEIKEVAGL